MMASQVQRDSYVYVLEGEDGKPCYIGAGKGKRMHHHIREARRGYFGSNREWRTHDGKPWWGSSTPPCVPRVRE